MKVAWAEQKLTYKDPWRYGKRGIIPQQQPAPGRRGKRHRDLELGVIAPARALPRISPCLVKHIFALAVALEIGGQDAKRRGMRILYDDGRGLPAGARPDTA